MWFKYLVRYQTYQKSQYLASQLTKIHIKPCVTRLNFRSLFFSASLKCLRNITKAHLSWKFLRNSSLLKSGKYFYKKFHCRSIFTTVFKTFKPWCFWNNSLWCVCYTPSVCQWWLLCCYGDYTVAEVKLLGSVLPSTFIKTWINIQRDLVNIFVYFYHQYSALHEFWYEHHWVFYSRFLDTRVCRSVLLNWFCRKISELTFLWIFTWSWIAINEEKWRSPIFKIYNQIELGAPQKSPKRS